MGDMRSAIVNMAYWMINSGLYEYKRAGKGWDVNRNGLYDVDCSGFVFATMRALGTSARYYDTQDFRTGKASGQYERITDPNAFRIGDIVVWSGHMGIIDDYNSGNRNGSFCGAQNSTDGLGWRSFGPGQYYDLTNAMVFRPRQSVLPSQDVVASAEDTFDSVSTATGPDTQSVMVVNLTDSEVLTTSVEDGPHFDYDANGFAQQSAWASSDNGVLVRDLNDDGTINDGSELVRDFEDLTPLDDNQDGTIDANDPAYASVAVWVNDELIALADAGIAAINLTHTNTDITDENGNTQVQAGTFVRMDQTTGSMGSIAMQTDATYTIANDWVDDADVASLPDLQGYGDVYDLHQAMVRDTGGDLLPLAWTGQARQGKGYFMRK